MRLGKHGILLGILFFLGLLSKQIISKKPDANFTVYINEPEQSSWS
ncbi:hypothetical protein HYV11_01670, partial [Candidatus Dependentiae bacterium]|nr:hypothetical protein [Candidatus Dependentiae bacterium]